MASLKELASRQDRLTGGHRMCPGCGAPILVRTILMSVKEPVVVACATGCLEVSTTIFPYSAWKTPFIHTAFENAAATISGVESAYNALKKRGKIDKEIKFIAFGGDGGTYDIGLQSLSGAMERGHDILYVCYDNQGYMNTSVQRSSATPRGASTTTEPAGKISTGKKMMRKDLTEMMVSNNCVYVAQTTCGHWSDLNKKIEKAMSIKGPKFINVLQPCQLGWAYPMELTVELSKVAAETCFWPLYEVENGVYKLNYDPKDKKKPLVDFLKPQGRFRHLFKPENKDLLVDLQREIDEKWTLLKKKCECFGAKA
ncbi:MAG: thiamine pyrophosphate-dependent enzyme [Candidatus Margulisiibacteriota bacterium]